MYVKGRSRSLIFELIQGYGGMHHWVKYCVNRCMKSEVIALTSFVTDAQTDGRLAFLCPPQWLRHGGGQKYEKNKIIVVFFLGGGGMLDPYTCYIKSRGTRGTKMSANADLITVETYVQQGETFMDQNVKQEASRPDSSATKILQSAWKSTHKYHKRQRSDI